MLPWTASSIAALSLTLRVSTKLTGRPPGGMPTAGAAEILPRLVFNPTSPHHPAGFRMDPLPSEPWAAGTMPAATAAADPPLEPPALRLGSHGLRVIPVNLHSVDADHPNSGVVVRPRIFRPAALNFRTSSESDFATFPFKSSDPHSCNLPLSVMLRSFKKKGTPPKG